MNDNNQNNIFLQLNIFYFVSSIHDYYFVKLRGRNILLTIFYVVPILKFPNKSELKIGDIVEIEVYLPGDSKMDEGSIKKILTDMISHPRGIKVELDSGVVGRVRKKLSSIQNMTEEDDYSEEIVQNNVQTSEPTSKLMDGESSEIEFKHTFSFDTKEHQLREEGKITESNSRKKDEKKIKQAIQKEVSITVSAFANTNGGILEIGKTDDGKISPYFEYDKKRYKNWDEYTRAIITSIKIFTNNSAFASEIEIQNSPGKEDYLRLKISKTHQPIFILDHGQEEFYIRSKSSAMSQRLTKQSEIMSYCRKQFPNWNP